MSAPTTRSFYMFKLDIIYGTRTVQTYFSNMYVYAPDLWILFLKDENSNTFRQLSDGWVNCCTILLAARPLWLYFYIFVSLGHLTVLLPPIKSGGVPFPFAMEYSTSSAIERNFQWWKVVFWVTPVRGEVAQLITIVVTQLGQMWKIGLYISQQAGSN